MNRHLTDTSAGYDALADEFIRRRNPTIGVATVRQWSQHLSPGGSVLDLGCGNGVPISQTLIAEAFKVYGIDAAPSMVEAFRARHAEAIVACEPAEDSDYFGLCFDGVVAWGLLFLLEKHKQLQIIERVASVLAPGGRFLFTSPKQACTWTDALTGRPSISLGAEAYRSALAEAGLVLVGQYEDEGGNHYFDAAKPSDH
ncbi:MAG TPA: class I SAM-dependent methyltransferase [Rhodothermales bacterium]|nr:class I SAM-dependent methyltransferase [Rhodothermales bacterium]